MKNFFDNKNIHPLDRQRLHNRRVHFWWFIAALCGAVCLIIGFLWVVYYAAFLKVSSVTIEGSTHISKEAVYEALSTTLPRSWFQGSLGPDHVFYWSLSEKHPDARRIMAELSSVAFETGWFDRAVRVRVEERQPFGVWCPHDDTCALFDKEGIVFASAPRTFGTLLLKIDGETGLLPVVGEPLFRDSEWLPRITMTLDALQDAGLPAKEVRVRATDLREWEAVTPIGTRLLFSFDFVPSQLAAVLSDFANKEKLGSLSYVDFRVPGRMYYK